LRDERFERIINEILNGKVKYKKDRRDILELAKKFRQKEDIDEFLGFVENEAKILNKKFFDEFVFDFLDINGWSDFGKKAKTKKESIEIHNNSKRKNIHTDENTIIFRRKEKRSEIYYKEFPKIDNDKIVAVENYESFLSIDFSLFNRNYLVLLDGFPSKMVQEFLKDKDVLFFVDFDFYGIEIFNKVECKEKAFFLPKNIEELIKNKGSRKLYKNQLFKKEKIKNNNNNKNINYLLSLIDKYSKCLEQEILNVD
jgi:hypothetical protein